MSENIEEAVKAGDIERVKALIPASSDAEIEAAFSLATIYEHGDIACYIIEEKKDSIDNKVIGEALRSAAAHNEAKLVNKILEFGDKIHPQFLLDALDLAIDGEYSDIIDALSKCPQISSVINKEGKKHVHVLLQAINKKSDWIVEKLLKFPGILVKYQHIISAEEHEMIDIVQMLKLAQSAQRHKDNSAINIWNFQKEEGEIGPHLSVELEKRKRRDLQIEKSK